MRGYNDWSNIDLRQVGATGGEFASLATVLSFGSSVAPMNVNAGGNVALGSGGTVALGSGGTVTLGSGGNVTLGSGGTITLGSGGNVTLGSGGTVTLGSGGTVTPGSNGTVTLGSGGAATLSAGGTITLGSGGTVTLGSGGTVTLGSGGTIALGSGGSVTIPSSGGSYTLPSNGGIVTLGSGGNVTLGSGGNVTLGSGGTIALGSGGNVTLGSGGIVTLGSGGIVALGSGGNVTLGSGGNVTLGSGGTIALGSGGNVTLGSGGNVTLGSGGTVTLGSGGNVTLGSGGNVTLGSGGSATLGAGGTVTLGSGGNVTLGSGGNVTLGSGGTVTMGSGGNVTLGSGGTATVGSLGGTITPGSGGTVTLGSGGTVTLGSGGTIVLGSGGTVTLGSGGSYTLNSSGGTITPNAGGTVTLGSGGIVTLGSGGIVALGSGGNVTLGSGGNVTLGSGGTIALGSGGNITLGSGGTVTLGSGGNVTLGSGGNVTLGSGGNVTLGSGGTIALGSGGSSTLGSGGPVFSELTYETANSIVRPPPSATETPSAAGVSPAFVTINWTAPVFGVVSTYTIYRSSDGATPIEIGSVSGINGYPPATTFTDTNPDLTSKTVVYTITTTLVPDTTGGQRSSPPSPPAVLTMNQSISLGPVPSSVTLSTTPLTVTATAMSAGMPNGLQVNFSATGTCSIGVQSITSNVSSATVLLNSTGSCTVTASQPGTTAYNAASAVSGTFTILAQGSNTLSQTISFAPLQEVQYGNTFSLSASSSAGLPVSFTRSGPCTISGLTGSTTGGGVCTITASAPANATYSAASVTQSFIISPAVLKVTAYNLTSVYGQPLPSLTYNYSGFVNGDTSSVVSGIPALSTTATTGSNAGSYPITVMTGTLAAANYDFLYVSGTLTIQPANQSALTLITTTPLTFNQSETLSVMGGTTVGAVTYTVTGGPCTVTGAQLNQLTANNGTGVCTVTATMAGNSNYNPITSTPANTVTLSQMSQTITFTTNPPASAGYNTSFTVAATGGASGNAVTFTSSGVCSNVGATYTMTSGTGTCSVIANQLGNTNYSAAPQVTKTVTASLVAQTITFTTNPPAGAAYNTSFTVAATGGASGNAVIFTSSGVCSNISATYSMTSGTGTCSVIANQLGNTNYSAAAQVTKTVTATLAAQTITFTTNAPASAAYNSSFTVAAKGGASGNAVTFTSSGACSNVGATYTMTNSTGSCSVIVNQLGNTNYSAAPQVAQTVTATGPLLTVSPASFSFGTVNYDLDLNPAIITVQNTGTATASISNVSLTLGSGTNTVDFTLINLCPSTLSPGQSCIISVVFFSGSLGPVSATLKITDNSPGSPQQIPLSAVVVGFNPSSLNFGTIKVGKSSTQSMTLSNTGTTALAIGTISITGSNPQDFVKTTTCPSSLAANASCTVSVTFTPGKKGSRSAFLNLSDNAPLGVLIAPLSGTGN